MATETNLAIDLLVAQIADLERKANAYRASVNILCERDGLPPMFPDDGGGGQTTRHDGTPKGGAHHPTQIKSDTFYGKAQQTAVRELLAIRKSTGNGPAKPNEILEGLRLGGYQVEAKNDDIALVGLRAMLRKRTNIFHKLPNGAWGLREWYPNAKPSKEAGDRPTAENDKTPSSQLDENEDVEEKAAAQPKAETAA